MTPEQRLKAIKESNSFECYLRRPYNIEQAQEYPRTAQALKCYAASWLLTARECGREYRRSAIECLGHAANYRRWAEERGKNAHV